MRCCTRPYGGHTHNSISLRHLSLAMPNQFDRPAVPFSAKAHTAWGRTVPRLPVQAAPEARDGEERVRAQPPRRPAAVQRQQRAGHAAQIAAQHCAASAPFLGLVQGSQGLCRVTSQAARWSRRPGCRLALRGVSASSRACAGLQPKQRAGRANQVAAYTGLDL